jgi:ubiquinone/menaquinone biosynthesis C-methylase UbiE
MADARDERVWTYHSEEHKAEKVHIITEEIFLRRKLCESLPNKTDCVVVDFGCGSGLWRNLFKEYNYIGVDQNAGMINVAKSRNLDNATFQQIDWNKLPFGDGTVDLIFTSAVIQHNKHSDKIPVLQEFHRVLRSGGFYLCTENTFRPDNYHISFRNQPFTDHLDDGYSFTASGWERFMRAQGFEQVEFSSPSEYLYKKI